MKVVAKKNLQSHCTSFEILIDEKEAESIVRVE